MQKVGRKENMEGKRRGRVKRGKTGLKTSKPKKSFEVGAVERRRSGCGCGVECGGVGWRGDMERRKRARGEERESEGGRKKRGCVAGRRERSAAV